MTFKHLGVWDFLTFALLGRPVKISVVHTEYILHILFVMSLGLCLFTRPTCSTVKRKIDADAVQSVQSQYAGGNSRHCIEYVQSTRREVMYGVTVQPTQHTSTIRDTLRRCLFESWDLSIKSLYQAMYTEYRSYLYDSHDAHSYTYRGAWYMVSCSAAFLRLVLLPHEFFAHASVS